MNFSSILITHGIAALKREIGRLEQISEQIENHEWPPGFDANDLPLLQSLLTTFLLCEGKAYEEERWQSKSIQFFFHLLPDYLQAMGSEVSAADRSELFRSYCEFQVRWCLKDLAHSTSPESGLEQTRHRMEELQRSIALFPRDL